jgi:hypothetical protein
VTVLAILPLAIALSKPTYRLEGQLHERGVVDLPDFIFGPVITRCLCVDSFLQDSSFPCLGRRWSGGG